MQEEEFNPYSLAAAEHKLRLCENERRRTNYFSAAVSLRKRLIKYTVIIRSGRGKAADYEKHAQLLQSFKRLLESTSDIAVATAEEQSALTEYGKLLTELYEDTLSRTEV